MTLFILQGIKDLSDDKAIAVLYEGLQMARLSGETDFSVCGGLGLSDANLLLNMT